MNKQSLIKTAAAKHTEQQTITENIRAGLTRLSSEPHILAEAATHILANIATMASEGKPLKVMHLDSVAAFMAGIERIAKALPASQDEQKKQTTLRTLAAASVGPDGFVTTAAAPIAQLGARFPELRQKYAKLVQDYSQSADVGQPNGQMLASAANQLRHMIDVAMRKGSQVASSAATPLRAAAVAAS